jgi:hypothetical protein
MASVAIRKSVMALGFCPHSDAEMKAVMGGICFVFTIV